jgi:hypothetical protein
MKKIYSLRKPGEDPFLVESLESFIVWFDRITNRYIPTVDFVNLIEFYYWEN